MRFDASTPVIVAPVEIETPGATLIVDMVLDTGSTFIVVSPSVARAAGCDPERATRHVKVTTASGLQSGPLVNLPSVTALGVTARDVEAVCFVLPAESRVQGLLGLSFLRHVDLDLHLRSGIIAAR